MKLSTKAFLFLFFSLFFCNVVSADISNGGFETWTTTTDAASWTEYGTLSQTTAHIRTGSYAALVEGSYSGVTQSASCSDTYTSATLSWYMYPSEWAPDYRAVLTFYDSEGTELSSQTNWMPSNTSAVWQHHSFTANVPSNTASVLIDIGIDYASTSAYKIYLDDISLTLSYTGTPTTIYTKDELTRSIIDNTTAVIIADGITQTADSSAGEIIFLNLDPNTYQLKVSGTNYYTRWLTISANETKTVYLPAKDTDVSLVGFSLIDFTGQLPLSSTTLKISKMTDDGETTISESNFSAAGISQTYLLNGDSYSLTLYTPTYERNAGYFVPGSQETVSLVVGSIPLLPDTTTYGGFNYNLTHTNNSISLAWTAPEGSLLEPFNFSIFDSNNTITHTYSSSIQSGTTTFNNADPLEQYKISITANTTGGTLSHIEYLTLSEKIIDMQISEKWENMISVFLILILMLCFGYRHASAGALICALSTAGLYVLGLLHISGVILALIVSLGILALLRGSNT